jgi:hypothetical protein
MHLSKAQKEMTTLRQKICSLQEMCDEQHLMVGNLNGCFDELDKGRLSIVLELWDVLPCP